MFPYDDEMLATITDTDIDVVRTAMKIFNALGLISILDNGTIYMQQMNELIGWETKWAEKKRNQRKKGDNVPHLSPQSPQDVLDESSSCPLDVRQEQDKEQDIDIDKDKDQQQHKIPEVDQSVNTKNKKNLKNVVAAAENLKNIANAFTKFTGRYPGDTDLDCMKQIIENEKASKIAVKVREKVIIQTMEKVSNTFKINNPGKKINSFKYFTAPVIEGLNKYLSEKEGVNIGQSNSSITNERECTIDFSKIPVHRGM